MLKRTLVITAIAGLTALASTANAAVPGFYLGGQLGYGNTHYGAGDFDKTSASVDKTGVAGRIFAGYQVNQNFAAELGYTKFSDTEVKNINSVSGLKGTVKQQAYDLVGKGLLPFGNGFSAYGTLGAAWVRSDRDGNLNSDKSRLFPTFGVGLSYDITPNVPVDISWKRIQKTGGSSAIQNADFYSVGVAYNFG